MFTKKFYMWEPTTHGPFSFGVLARSEKRAYAVVDKYIKMKLQQPLSMLGEGGFTEYNCEGWGTGGYVLEVFGRGEVMTHPND